MLKKYKNYKHLKANKFYIIQHSSRMLILKISKYEFKSDSNKCQLNKRNVNEFLKNKIQ
jgi:hypothetical protein